MLHPEWVSKHKMPNTEIRKIRERYYLYNITSVWCPIKKRTKKKTLKQVGVIDKEYGLIPTGMSRKGKIPQGESKIKGEENFGKDFLSGFNKIDDPRSKRNRWYTLGEILLLSFLAILCGADGWTDIESYGKAKLKYLRKFFNYTHGIPSDDTIRRFFSAVDPTYFKKIFHKWIQHIAAGVSVEVISIDGKCSRRTYDEDNKMLHMVSAFSSDCNLVLGQEKVSNKSNEITAIPKLLHLLDIEGKIITIDAMGCQYSIADQITQGKGEYVFSLKGNQGNLLEDVTLFFEDITHGKYISSCLDFDKAHGRIERRECFICTDVTWLKELNPKWNSINSIVKIKSTREFKDVSKNTEETRFYISSIKTPKPKSMLSTIRKHWGIENTLHWVLDMSFNEDYSRIRKGHAPEVMAIIRHFTLNLLQQFKNDRQSIVGLRKICAWDENTLTQLLATSNFNKNSS